ncbi:GspE/PulE family protein [Paucibacter sp. DJ2R-2]|uniref:GspE/PulE family protein n=1 Tax=Paucibacter sp. DJ2R-2 TaxID=2893558 RepID=UPI0021E3859B|nr:type II/IV secretion system protein [Paucibacter sp. DJ2R-2]MCV2423117.1 Flp pilus assembly complex ATPase component TadA [Paucibacter sp. DJ4R-1]MCV2441012.1 Flp pilus assembly complex ATPase component TadA [Paucibacter sp. DJ2R-2]
MLLERNLLRPADLQAGLSYQTVHGGLLGAVLMRMGAITSDSLYPVLAEQLGLSLVRTGDLDELALRAALLALGPIAHRILDQAVLPWQDEAGHWHLASADPLQADLCESMAELDIGREVFWHLIPEADFAQWQQRLMHAELVSQALDVRALRELAEDAPVIALVNNLVAQAVEARASDIHLEPGEREFEVRLRIDGVLHLRQTLGMDRYPAVASRIKLIAGIDIAERRLPQDGRISMRAAGTEIDVRVSSIPAVFGESIVMRLLPKRRSDLSLDRLGMRPVQLATFKRWLGMPNGLVLVTGPTGSGKSTTLYSALAATNDFTRKIVTVEDPVEFRLPHVIQVQTQADIGYTFAKALRAFLRHDPDVIMIGEIRDRETAEIAIQSALTGHLVLATLHTNDALSAITRLVDMGVEPFLVAAALRAVIAQRLVRRLCESCSEASDAPAALTEAALQLALDDAASDGIRSDDLPRWRRPIGCSACEQTGFRGRVGIYEMLTLGPELQHAVAQGESMETIGVLAHQQGRRSLEQEGVLKTATGVSTLDEVLRATGGTIGD